MLYGTPPLVAVEGDLGRLDRMREDLGLQLRAPARWQGGLRRLARVQAVISSTAIEGHLVSEDEGARILAGHETPAVRNEDREAVLGYGQAMDRVLALAGDPHFDWTLGLLLDLHFLVCYYSPKAEPGRLRSGSVWLRDGAGGDIVYEPPPAEAVPRLMAELMAWMQTADDVHPVVRASMAHLHLASIHPFRDGNGRMARILHSLVLAREGVVAPELGSIEAYLGRHTHEYYAALHEAQGDRYHPERSALPWVRFAVTAHLSQAERALAVIRQARDRLRAYEQVIGERRWPDRFQVAFEQALAASLEYPSYQEETGISNAMAKLDLRRLIDAGFLVRERHGRHARFVAGPKLTKLTKPSSGG